MDPDVTFLEIAPTYVVSNLQDALAFYQGVLGFQPVFLNGDPPVYAVLKRGQTHLHLQARHLEHQQAGFSHCYITVSGVEPLYHQLCELGVPMVHALERQAYGMRDFVVQDPDGNHIGFGEKC